MVWSGRGVKMTFIKAERNKHYILAGETCLCTVTSDACTSRGHFRLPVTRSLMLIVL